MHFTSPVSFKTYRIGFRYDLTNSGNRRVTANLTTRDLRGNPSVEFTGESILHPRDPWNKELGRKLALTRALKGLSKPTRTQAWKAYFGRFTSPVEQMNLTERG